MTEFSRFRCLAAVLSLPSDRSSTTAHMPFALYNRNVHKSVYLVRFTPVPLRTRKAASVKYVSRTHGRIGTQELSHVRFKTHVLTLPSIITCMRTASLPSCRTGTTVISKRWHHRLNSGDEMSRLRLPRLSQSLVQTPPSIELLGRSSACYPRYA